MMKSLSLRGPSFWLSIALTGAVACAPKPAPTPARAAPRQAATNVVAKWDVHRFAAGRFMIDAPAGAKQNVERVGNDDVIQYEVLFQAAGVEYEVTYADIGQLPLDKSVDFLDGMADLLASRNGRAVRARRSLQVRDYPARELDLAAEHACEHWRYVMVGRRYYQLGVKARARCAALAKPFFDSFVPWPAEARVHSLHRAGLDLQLPHGDWSLAADGREEGDHWATIFTKGNKRPGPAIMVHVQPVPRGFDVMEFSAIWRTHSPYKTDPDRCGNPRGTNGEYCVFIHQDGLMTLKMAVGGFYYRVDDGRRSDAYVVHGVYFDRGITITLQAPTEQFLEVEPEFRQVLRSLHAHPVD